MSRITTSSASFSRARAAMRRACSREVRVCSCPWIAFFLQCSPGSRTVKPALRDEPRDGVRDQPVERLTRSDAGADVRRGGRIRLDLEEADALPPLDRLEDLFELAARKAGPGRDREPRAVEHLRRLAPGEKVPELVGTDHEDRVVEALGPEQIDRTRVAVEADVVGREGGSRQCEPILSGRVNLAVCGTVADEDDEPLHAELLSRGLGDGDMAEVRRGAGA